MNKEEMILGVIEEYQNSINRSLELMEKMDRTFDNIENTAKGMCNKLDAFKNDTLTSLDEIEGKIDKLFFSGVKGGLEYD